MKRNGKEIRRNKKQNVIEKSKIKQKNKKNQNRIN
jgi:hypothetical protein